jgi:hypothetical protein
MQPMFFAALAFAAGIAAVAAGAGWTVAAAMAALGGALLGWARWRPGARRWAAGAGALALLAAGGWGWARWRAGQAPAPDSLAAAVARWQHGAKGTVAIGGYLRDTPEVIRDYQRFDLQAAYIAAPGGITGVSGAVRVYLDTARWK